MTAPVSPIMISSGSTGWAWCVDADGELRQLAMGPSAIGATVEVPAILYPRAVPTFGTEPHRRTALRVTHHDGTRSTRLRVEGVERTETAEGERLRILMVDPQFNLSVQLVTETWRAQDVAAQWIELTNAEPGSITVWECASSAPLLHGPAPTWTHLGGGWAGEWEPTNELLADGVKVVESTGGIRPHLQQMPVVLASVDGRWTETAGNVLAGQLAWTGNTCFEAEVRQSQSLRLLCGASLRASEMRVDPGGTLRTPQMIWAWSSDGLGPLSRRLHQWTRRHRLRDGERDRVIVANNWEATWFDFDETRLIALVDDAAELGAELFLLDDGWFGSSHPRDDDTQGLGDWTVDEHKLPNGLTPVIDAAIGRGIRFGLWIEPEMVNPGSTLHASHPDWVLGDPVRPRPDLERHQLALDLLRPEVRGFIVDTVDTILRDHPGISYLKWDANRALVETGSSTLDADHQGRVLFDLVDATWAVMGAVAERHPAVEMMLCASGGGRVDLGALRYFHEVWTSDNTDPLARVRMQWCASWFLPAQVLGAHVTRWGGLPIAFSAAVAMSARFGWDLDTAAATPEERSVLRRAADMYRRIRPLVQRGDLYRFASPFEQPRSALGYLDPASGAAVVFGYQLEAATDLGSLALGLPLRDGNYTVTSTSLDSDDNDTAPEFVTIAAETLLDTGLSWPLDRRATAMIWELDPT